MSGISHNPGVDGDVVALDPERSLAYTEVDSDTGEVVISSSNNTPLIVIAAAAPSDSDGRPDGVVYIQTEA